jgi:hypothetical protein
MENLNGTEDQEASFVIRQHPIFARAYVDEAFMSMNCLFYILSCQLDVMYHHHHHHHHHPDGISFFYIRLYFFGVWFLVLHMYSVFQ